MSHITDDEALEVMAGRTMDEVAAHLARCPACAARVERWRETIEVLSEVRGQGLEQPERHRLRAIFTAWGPTPSSARMWLASLTRSTSAVPAPIRSAASSVLAEHVAGPYRLTTELRRLTGSGGQMLYGQLETDDGHPVGPAEAIAVDDIGAVHRAPLDEFGEFTFDTLAARPIRLVLDLADERIVVDGLPTRDELS